ncbi:5-oxoprolinase subunit C family protein [Frigidibacter oleivorans]|uniref:5-oxoprolinase subunit C family protein n=1 Tax=Frigidibacter oleivorans TaxID=2487129 RepID=UPI0013DF1DAA|nr:biotin-dependent carboxyltransferase family protein [Frigidibacter oleivorans]
MTARLQVVAAGPHVTVQDAGRPGLMRFGVPGSGPMDRLAFAAGNRALGNPAGAAGIEVSPGGLVLDCTTGAVGVAVTGGGFLVTLNGVTRPGWWRGTLRSGDRLAIRPGSWGSWACLCLAGDLEASPWLGSRATHAPSGLGGGRLAAGQGLTVHAPREVAAADLILPLPARPRHAVRVTMGPQERFFDAAARSAFLSGPWRLSPAFDRMGLRLAGPAIPPAATLDMPSEAVSRGSVQVAGDGVATVLMADHQTTGGYPKIATVIDADLDALAQLRPGDRLAFRAVTPDMAVTIARRHAATVARYLDGLGRYGD